MNDELLGRSLLFAICTSRRPVLCSIVFLQTLAPLERETPRLWGSTVTGCAACVSYEHCPLVYEAFSPRRKLFLWLWARIRGLENRPGDFGAPLGRITGGARIDEIVLPHGTTKSQGMLGNVGPKGSIRDMEVGECTSVHRDGHFSGWHDQRGHPTNGLHLARDGNKHGHFATFIVKQVARKETAALTRRLHSLYGNGGIQFSKRPMILD